jgi:nucleoside-diphosphate-sugar epimerase
MYARWYRTDPAALIYRSPGATFHLPSSRSRKPFIDGLPVSTSHDLQYHCCKLAVRKLGWEPSVSLKDGLVRTAEYFEKAWSDAGRIRA